MIKTEIRLIAGLAFLFILYSVWMGQVTVQGLPDHYRNPVLALELVKDGEDINKIVKAGDGKALKFLKKSTYKDFGYIFIYAVFFISLSQLLSRMDFSWARFVGLLAAACATLAAVLDLMEDRGMLKALAGEASNSLAKSIRYPSLGKWTFLFIFDLLIGLLLMARRDAFVILVLCFLVACVLGLTGVVLNLLQPRFYWMFPAALLGMGIAVIILAVAFTFWPEKLLDKYPQLGY